MDRRHFIAGASGASAAAAAATAANGQARSASPDQRAAAMAAAPPSVVAAVSALRFRLMDALNTKNFEAFAATFTANGVWEVPGAFSAVGRDAIRGRIEGFIKADDWLTQLYQGDAVLSATSGEAHARAYFTEYGQRAGAPHFVVGVYDEVCVKDRGVWRYAKRTSNLSYRGPADLSAKPTRVVSPPAPG